MYNGVAHTVKTEILFVSRDKSNSEVISEYIIIYTFLFLEEMFSSLLFTAHLVSVTEKS